MLADPCFTLVLLIVREIVPGMGAGEYNADDAPVTFTLTKQVLDTRAIAST
jgi:hypothetical protein